MLKNNISQIFWERNQIKKLNEYTRVNYDAGSKFCLMNDRMADVSEEIVAQFLGMLDVGYCQITYAAVVKK